MRIIHISAGSIALFVGPGVMLTVKGARWHRLWGKIFVASMAMVAVTAIPMAFYHPSPFLQMVAAFSFYLAFSGCECYAAVKKTQLSGEMPCFAAWRSSAVWRFW